MFWWELKKKALNSPQILEQQEHYQYGMPGR